MIKANKTALAVAAFMFSAAPLCANECVDGKTVEAGVLSTGTGNPAYSSWVLDDDPESGEGFDKNSVKWTRTGFDEAIKPGAKSFDFNIQQFSIRPEREQVIDFSVPHYTVERRWWCERS
jgi:polar amino acid transport system substrate-binding protein